MLHPLDDLDSIDQMTTWPVTPLLGIGAAASRLRVPSATIRTWGRRYGLVPSARTPGGHRRFDARDLTRLQLMSDLLAQDVPARVAAQVAMRWNPDEPATGVGAEAPAPDAAPVPPGGDAGGRPRR